MVNGCVDGPHKRYRLQARIVKQGMGLCVAAAADAGAGFWYDPAPMTPNRLGAEGGAFTLNGRRMFLYDGELHYFRVRPELWRPGLERLKAAGLEVSRVDDDLSVVEGTIEASRTHDLQKIECVRYVRSVFTYLADYPPGDPRDRDGQ